MKNLHLTIWLCLTLKYNACSVKPGRNINIKQSNPPMRVKLYKHPYNDKTTSINENKSKFFVLYLQNLNGNVTNFVMLSCFSNLIAPCVINLHRKLHGSKSINEKSHACLAKCL